jgi:alpha-L-fucosidase
MPIVQSLQHQRPDAPHMKWWTASRFGLSLHCGLYSQAGKSEWLRSIERLTIEQYQPLFDSFAPAPGCFEQWADAAIDAGATHVVLTAKHHDGFCLWDSKLTGYTSMNTPARRDLIREYVDTLRRRGLRVGLYYSLVDWHHFDYGPVFNDRQHPLRHDPRQAILDGQRDWSRYVRFMHGQIQELLTGYGTIDVLYFDFSYWKFRDQKWGASELMQNIRHWQPGIVVNDRLGCEAIKQSNPPDYAGDFDHVEQNLPRDPVVDASGNSIAWEAWFTLNNTWCHSHTDQDYKSASTVVRALVNAVSKNGNLSLNIAPDAAGHLNATTRSILARVGRWMLCNGSSVRGCCAAALPKPEWGRWTLSSDARHLYAHFLEPVVGHISLPGLRGRVEHPHVLSTNTAAILSAYWNPGVQTFDQLDDLFLNFRTPVQCSWPAPDEIDTVVRLDVVRDPDRYRQLIEQFDTAFRASLQERPFD